MVKKCIVCGELSSKNKQISFHVTMELPKIKHEHEFLQEPQPFKATEILEEKCNSADEIMEYNNLCMEVETISEEIHIKDEPPTNLAECSAQLDLQSSSTTRAEITTFKCKFCPLTLPTKRLLDSHKLIHLNGKPLEGKYDMSTVGIRKYAVAKSFKCFTCGRNFRTNSHLIIHIRTHTGEKPFECITCGRKFAQKTALVSHIRIHTGEKPFQCDTCGRKFGTRTHLVYHVKTHMGEKPFECVTCGRKFAVKGGLVRHVSTHTGEKPFKCVTCSHKFALKGALVSHIKTHTAFECVTCGHKFATKCNLVNHIWTHTGEKPSKFVTRVVNLQRSAT